VDVHPFRAAWQTRDLDAWSSNFAPDIVLYSPMIKMTFRGQEAATELYGVLFDALEEFQITDEFARQGEYACFWRAKAGGRTIEGSDLIGHDEHGKIAEVRVFIRPLASIAIFAAAAGPPLAAKRGPVKGLLLRVLTVPLRVIFAAVDFLAPRLIQRRR
jgi:ketosteroid isomerase-like protein